MAITQVSAGDNYHLLWNTRAKKPRSTATAYTSPAVGDLVKLDGTDPNAVAACVDDDNPYGIVDSINSNNGILSVTELVSGCIIELPVDTVDGAVAVGDAIEVAVGGTAVHGSSLDRTKIAKAEGSGVGKVIAIDSDCPHGTGHALVRFS